MARYRKIDTRIWNDAKFRELSERGQLEFLFGLTHPNMTMLGAMRATLPGLAAEYGHGISAEAFREAFQEALSKGMAKHDEKACFLWFPNFLKYNKPESPNVVKSWAEAFDMLPECAMKGQLFQHVKAFTEGLTKGFQEAFAEAFPEDFAKAMPNQEPEQEPEQEQEKKGPSPYRTEATHKNQVELFVDTWNERRGTLLKVSGLSNTRRKKIQARIQGGLTLEQFSLAVQTCASAPFLTGENDRHWRATFDWLIKNDLNAIKVIEGNYDNPKNSKGASGFKGTPASAFEVPAVHPSRVRSLGDIRAEAGIQ